MKKTYDELLNEINSVAEALYLRNDQSGVNSLFTKINEHILGSYNKTENENLYQRGLELQQLFIIVGLRKYIQRLTRNTDRPLAHVEFWKFIKAKLHDSGEVAYVYTSFMNRDRTPEHHFDGFDHQSFLNKFKETKLLHAMMKKLVVEIEHHQYDIVIGSKTIKSKNNDEKLQLQTKVKSSGSDDSMPSILQFLDNSVSQRNSITSSVSFSDITVESTASTDRMTQPSSLSTIPLAATNKDEDHVKEFIRIYKALRKGQTGFSFMKTNFLADYKDELKDTQKMLKNIALHIDNSKNSRTALAWDLAKKGLKEDDLFKTIHENALARSGCLARTHVAYKFSKTKKNSPNLSYYEFLGVFANTHKNSRTAKILRALNPASKPSKK